MAYLGKTARIVDGFTAEAEDVVLSVVSRLAPVAAAIPNAVMVARATSAIFNLPPGLSYVIAGSMELIGQGVTRLWSKSVDWNETKRKTDAPANTPLALGMMIAYFALDVGLVAALAIPNWIESGDVRQLFAVAYPLVGIVSTIALNERVAQFRREAAVEAEKAERAERRNRNRHKPERTPAQGAAPYMATSDGTRQRAAAILAERPGISGSELGRQLGRSPRLGRKLKAELMR